MAARDPTVEIRPANSPRRPDRWHIGRYGYVFFVIHSARIIAEERSTMEQITSLVRVSRWSHIGGESRQPVLASDIFLAQTNLGR